MEAECETCEDPRKLLIIGLDYETNEDSLKTHFEQWGEIIECVVARDQETKKSRGFGYITYKQECMADDAQAAHLHKIDGCEVEAKPAVPRECALYEEGPEQFRKLFVGGLNFKTTDYSLKSHFEKWDEIVDCFIMRDLHTKKSKGFGFVTFRKEDIVDDVQAHRPHIIDGREVETKRAIPREDSTKPEAQTTAKEVFVGGIQDMEEEDLKDYFGQFGKIISCRVVKEKDTGKKKGFAFVEFDDYDPVDKIMLKRPHILKGKKRGVEKALPKRDMPNLQRRGMVGDNRDRNGRSDQKGRDFGRSEAFRGRDNFQNTGFRGYSRLSDAEFGGSIGFRDLGGRAQNDQTGRDFGGSETFRGRDSFENNGFRGRFNNSEFGDGAGNNFSSRSLGGRAQGTASNWSVNDETRFEQDDFGYGNNFGGGPTRNGNLSNYRRVSRPYGGGYRGETTYQSGFRK